MSNYYCNTPHQQPDGMCYITQPCYEQGDNVWAQCEYCGVCYNVFLTPRDSYGGGVDLNQCKKEITQRGKYSDFLRVFDWALQHPDAPAANRISGEGVSWLGNACCSYTNCGDIADAYNYAESPVADYCHVCDADYYYDWYAYRCDHDFAMAINPFWKERMRDQMDYLSVYGNWKDVCNSGSTYFSLCDCRGGSYTYCACNGGAWLQVGGIKSLTECGATEQGWVIPYMRPYACAYLCMSCRGDNTEVYSWGGEPYDGAGCSCVCICTIECYEPTAVCKYSLCNDPSLLLQMNGADYLHISVNCNYCSYFNNITNSNGECLRIICPTPESAWCNSANEEIAFFSIVCIPACHRICYTFVETNTLGVMVPSLCTITTAQSVLLQCFCQYCPAGYSYFGVAFQASNNEVVYPYFRDMGINLIDDATAATPNLDIYYGAWIYSPNVDMTDYCIITGGYNALCCVQAIGGYVSCDVCVCRLNDGSCYIQREPCETDGVLYFGLPNYAIGSIPIKRIKCTIDNTPNVSYMRNESSRAECWSARDMAFAENSNKYKFCFITFPNSDETLIDNVPKMMSCAIWYYLCSYKCEAGQYVAMCKSSVNVLSRDMCGAKMTYYSFQGFSVGGAYL